MNHQTMNHHARILITGSRNFGSRPGDEALMSNTLWHIQRMLIDQGARDITLVHGAARGADQLAGQIGNALSMRIETHPAQWNTYGKRAGLIRNQEMVNAGADVVLAFPVGESRGTRHCMRQAHAAGLTVINVTEQQ